MTDVLGFTPVQFKYIALMSSWAVSGTRAGTKVRFAVERVATCIDCCEWSSSVCFGCWLKKLPLSVNR